MRLSAAVVFLVVLPFSACSSSAYPPSRAAFSEQILGPLADKRAGEMIEQWKADARLHVAKNAGAGWNVELLSLGADYLAPGAGAVLRSLKGNPQQQLQEYWAWLDTRREPLKIKLVSIYESRIREQDVDQIFAVCVDGKQRRYARWGFQRLEDGSGPCEVTKVLPNE